jgi:hypothetical protein
MGMMDAAANQMLQSYYDMLEKRGVIVEKNEGGVPGFPATLNLAHVMWMCQEAQTLADPEKKNRWIGFIQGCLWMSGTRTIEELKNEVIVALQETRDFEAAKHQTAHLKQSESLYCHFEGCRKFAEWSESGYRTNYCKEHTPIPMEVLP